MKPDRQHVAIAVMALLAAVLRLADADPRFSLGLGIAAVSLAAIKAAWLWAPFRKLVRFLTVEQWKKIDEATVRKPDEAGRVDYKVCIILITVAVVLTLQEYYGSHDTYEKWFPFDGSDNWELWGFVWWAGWRACGYVLVPILVIKLLLPGEKLADYNLSFKGFFSHIKLYAGMFLLIFPVVLWASTTPAFRHMYPFYRFANRSYGDLIKWELIYAAQFTSLEFFFRGFILQGLRRALGANAVFVMAVPYCMIHYGKPFPETIGAIFAGIILGTFAMRTKSIWGGVMIHVGVAISMDMLAMRACPAMGSGHFCHSK